MLNSLFSFMLSRTPTKNVGVDVTRCIYSIFGRVTSNIAGMTIIVFSGGTKLADGVYWKVFEIVCL